MSEEQWTENIEYVCPKDKEHNEFKMGGTAEILGNYKNDQFNNDNTVKFHTFECLICNAKAVVAVTPKKHIFTDIDFPGTTYYEKETQD